MDSDQSNAPRRWTNDELHKLYQDYFKRLPGICPVCGHEVSMMMEHKDQTTLLTIRCRFCHNSSVVLG